MTADEILAVAQHAGVRLSARGDRLHVQAPAGALTPELRAALARHKAELLALLSPAGTAVMLRGGLTVPMPALQLAWSLEDRDIRLTTGADHQLVVPAGAPLTEADRAGLARWRLHLAAIAEYEAPKCA